MHYFLLVFLLLGAAVLPGATGDMPAPGDMAPAFELESVRGGQVRIAEVYAEHPVVLVVLRGFPGYQCPFCQRQVADFGTKAAAFAKAGVKVVFVYPGDAGRGKEFHAKGFPAEFELLLDPEFRFAEAYGIRWDAPKETVYPTTFLLEKGGRVHFVKSARMHGGRTSSSEVLELLPKK